MAVLNMDHFKGHLCSPLHSVFVAACRAEAAMAAERDKFKFAAAGAAIHGAAKGRVTTVDHLVYIFYFTVAWM